MTLVSLSHICRHIPRGISWANRGVVYTVDRRLLGRSSAGRQPYSLSWSPPHIPPSKSESAHYTHPRILEDASHHFQPFSYQASSYRPSQFVSPVNPNPLDQNMITTRPTFGPAVFHGGSQRRDSHHMLTPLCSGLCDSYAASAGARADKLRQDPELHL
jgi:hypothetical protein